MRLKPQKVEFSKLLFDPNNYRFLDLPKFRPIDPNRAHEKRVQEQAYKRLRDDNEFEIKALKDSILANGFVPLERIVVQKYSSKPETWLVIEGNRRLAAIKWLLEDHEAAVCNLTRQQLTDLQNLDCLTLDAEAKDNESAIKILMAIRHVSGIKQWAAYQQARLIVEMIDDLRYSFQEVSNRISLSVRETIRRYRASKALKQMEKDEEFQDFARPELYAFFHEAVGQPIVREWLGWNESTYRFEHDEHRTHFYEWLTPRVVSDEEIPPKIQSALTHVRQLKVILQDRRALQILLDPERPFEDAYVAAQRSSSTSDYLQEFEQVISRTIEFLNDLPTLTLKQLSDEQSELLDKLRDRIEETQNDFSRLKTDQP